MELVPNQQLRGFTIESVEALPEIGGKAVIMSHDVSGAKLIYLQNDDNNKAFSIGFRTPPQDDTGVFHILEHSVLCGSDKFPVKEPFVDLLKSSMQTFLNAMTFSDKTMYPVASTNEQDLFNLMDVYLDAVFHPAIYHKKAVFEQEGWHYELTETEDGGQQLVYNGVVFNEMKGALSDSSSVLYDELQKALFPDTAYAFESGGTPEAIPTLTYENYLDEHARHYRLSNSYTVLYGNLDINRALAWIDERYFASVAAEQAAADAERAAAGEPALLPRTIATQAAVSSLDNIRRMDTAPENAVAGVAYVLGTAHERTRVVAADILLDALFGSNEAPMKRALLDAGIADDVSAFVADGLNQPFAVVQLKKQRDEAAKDLVPTLEAELEKLLADGLDRELIEASLSHEEFVMREGNFGIADGVLHAMNCLAGWLYDDSLATAYLRYEDTFAFLHEALNDGYFDDLARSIFLENDHRASVAVVPTPAEGDSPQALELAAKTAALSDAQRDWIKREEALLREMQMQADSPEAQATLPRLSIDDIDEAPIEQPLQVVDGAPLSCLRHQVPTHGIAYAYRYFDAGRLSFDELPYATILSLVLGKLGTAHHTAAQIDTLSQGKLGNLSFYADLFEDADDPNGIALKFVVSSSALEANAAWLADLPREILTETDFSDTSKIRDILQQRKIYLEQGFSGGGNTRAAARVASYYSPAGVVTDQMGNVGFYRFLKNLLANFDELAPGLPAHLQAVAQQIFQDDGCIVSFTGSDAAWDTFWAANPSCNDGGSGIRSAQSDGAGKLVIPEPIVRNEAFIVPTDVTYSALGYDRRLLGLPYTGAWSVAARTLTYDHLWNEVRVKGGAYGVSFQSVIAGGLRFTSYRDPHIDETFERFAASVNYLRSFNPTKTDMDGFVVSSVAGYDSPKKARDLIRRQDAEYFTGRTTEQRSEVRAQIAGADVDIVRGFADPVQRVVEADMRCVFGNKQIIEAAKADFQVIDLLNE
jgi:presequence protease